MTREETQRGFNALEIRDGLLLDLSGDPFPTLVYGWKGESLGLFGRYRLELPDGATHYGVVLEGTPTLDCMNGFACALIPGMFFVVPGECLVEGGVGLVLSRLGFQGLFQLGGPLEPEGRLRYIDGCSDTLLVSPPRLGDPCLNHLHIPPHAAQTAHTHPSQRLGVILRGSGECRTPDAAYRLEPGMGWHIATGAVHSFHTGEESLDVIAWHPDSDFGPTDQDHPMINRTIIPPREKS